MWKIAIVVCIAGSTISGWSFGLTKSIEKDDSTAEKDTISENLNSKRQFSDLAKSFVLETKNTTYQKRGEYGFEYGRGHGGRRSGHGRGFGYGRGRGFERWRERFNRKGDFSRWRKGKWRSKYDFNINRKFKDGCAFPWPYGTSDMVYPITPYELNGGWAMSPNQACRRGTWCPYACAPGYYSTQWDPSANQANGPGSMNGGLYCDSFGVLRKPFPDRPYCAKGVNNANIRNTLPKPISACQTVYPGNEAMVIPSVAQPGSVTPLNVVPNTYWAGTSSQFYVNLAGSTEAQCIWGNPDKPVGNWGPYIFGAGQAKDGNTYISVQYNPLYSQVGFKTANTYNVEIKCISGFCNFPEPKVCKCEKGVCSVKDGCTVTLVGNAKAEFVIY
ncbi:putative secreted beta-glucosidase adg3 [Smittium mucronatum]|uniref:Putative secreted beta-glucosidase adg3 n=1 Tax=Smittium mucronatum TaxID=133383 RepID=A0A1R0GU69_9FUNG|nr:putative secreted beta-glucosidase adg3 [Smittium mucronatum]